MWGARLGAPGSLAEGGWVPRCGKSWDPGPGDTQQKDGRGYVITCPEVQKIAQLYRKVEISVFKVFQKIEGKKDTLNQGHDIWKTKYSRWV